jgi:hypothetical protein
MDAAKIKEAVLSLFDQLDVEGFPIAPPLTSSLQGTFFKLYTSLFDDETAAENTLVGGRIITLSDISKHGDDDIEAYKVVLKTGGNIGTHRWSRNGRTDRR